MIWLFILLLLWVGIGGLMLWLGSRQNNPDYKRRIKGRVFSTYEPIEVHLLIQSPIEESQIEDHDVVILIDNSGSMGEGPGSPLAEARRAAENFIRRCPGRINIAVVRFDHHADLICSLKGSHRQALRALGSIRSGGATAIHLALDAAKEALRQGRTGVKKTAILLSDGGSDRDLALDAASRLIGAQEVCLLSVGLGSFADHPLLKELARDPSHYLKVDEVEDLEPLFGFLFGYLSGGMAVAGLVIEETMAPCPFELKETGELHPVSVQGDLTTEITWALPLMKPRENDVRYTLMATCPGWHKVAGDKSKASWKMPNGSRQQQEVPRAPRVLILPELLTWAWPILNPLFWLIFSRCKHLRPEPESVPVPQQLERATLPALPTFPGAPAFTSKVRPALVIGLGEVGTWTVCRLGERLLDRGIEASRVGLLSFDLAHPVNRSEVRSGARILGDAERIPLYCDLRPYLEALRNQDVPIARAWVPWQEWLGLSLPQSTQVGIEDRRKARLAFLLSAAAHEPQLATRIREVAAQDGLVIITGAVDDPEFSGLAGEIAHVCATHGMSTTVAATRLFQDRDDNGGQVALVRELERFFLLGGEAVFSDRCNPAVSAKKLFDRYLQVVDPAETVERCSHQGADLIWNLLAYEALDHYLAPPERDLDRLYCWSIRSESFHFPLDSLWRWVQSNTLSTLVNAQWLGIQWKDQQPYPSEPDARKVDGAVKSFWLGAEVPRPRGLVLEHALSIKDAPNPTSAILNVSELLPGEDLYHNQVAFWKREQSIFFDYCEAWCHGILATEAKSGSWGLPLLLNAMTEVEQGFRMILARIDALSGNEDFRQLTSLTASLYRDLAAGLTSQLSRIRLWVGQLTGPRVEADVAPPASGTWACNQLEQRRVLAEAGFQNKPQPVRELAKEYYKKWLDQVASVLLEQLRFEVVRVGTRMLDFQLRVGNEVIGSGHDPIHALDNLLAPYRSHVLSWPIDKAWRPSAQFEPFNSLRLGRASAQAYPDLSTSMDETDPYLIGCMECRPRPLVEVLGIDEKRQAAVPYVWPEEACAAMLQRLVRNRLHQTCPYFGPDIVQYLTHAERLYAYLADLAEDRVTQKGADLVLKREGQTYYIGKSNNDLDPFEALANFGKTVRQVAALGIDVDGTRLPEPAYTWVVSPEDAVRAIEAHPFVQAAKTAPSWPHWQNVIRGLALNYGE